MARRGPAPAPTALKLLRGETHLDRINDHEPTPRAALPDEPDDASEEVTAVWRDTVRELAVMDLANACDAPSLRAYCEAVVAHRRCSRVLADPEAGALLIPGAMGGLVRNPLLAMQRDAATTLLRFAQEFGLTPSARSAIKTQEAAGGGQGNPFASTGS